jgi:hypothetical protein
MTKRSLIVGLLGINLFLLAALILGSYSLPSAYAQRVGGASNFIAVTCEADQDYDVLFVIDLAQRKMHTFAATRNRNGDVLYKGARDLKEDFGR